MGVPLTQIVATPIRKCPMLGGNSGMAFVQTIKREARPRVFVIWCGRMHDVQMFLTPIPEQHSPSFAVSKQSLSM